MHELALADAVIRTALDAAKEKRIRTIVRIDVRVGELQQIKRDVFEFALKEVRPAGDPALEGTEITLEIERARFCCRPCGAEFTLDEIAPRDDDEAEAIHFIPELAHAYVRCPHCNSPDFDLLAGRGVSIQSIEGDTE